MGAKVIDSKVVTEYLETGVIVTHLWTAAILSWYDKSQGIEKPDWAPWMGRLMTEMETVEAAGKAFQAAVWFGGQEPWNDPSLTEPFPGFQELQQYKKDAYGKRIKHGIPGSLQAFVLAAEYHGYSSTVGNHEYISYSMAGRSIFQVSKPSTGHYVSFIFDETSPNPRGGVRSIHAHPKEAVRMFTHAILNWQEGKIQLVQGESIGF